MVLGVLTGSNSQRYEKSMFVAMKAKFIFQLSYDPISTHDFGDTVYKNTGQSTIMFYSATLLPP